MTSRNSLGWRRCLVVVIVAGLMGGCTSRESPGGKAVHPVRGQVLVQKRPAVGAEWYFVPVHEPPEPTDPRPRGRVGEDGTFTLSTFGVEDGAPTGEYVVTIVWPGGVLPDGREEPRDKLHGRYADPRRSTLRATIREGQNELEPFQL